MSKRLIIVLGMHRSGTSTITRGLQVLGVDLGSCLMPPAAGNNDKGFWEDLEINAFNVALLQSIGHDWNTPGTIAASDFAGPGPAGFRDQAVALLRKKFADTDLFGMKDPRLARLLPFWLEVFGELRIEASFVIASRQPLSVAESLAKRDGIPRKTACLLWFEHMHASLLLTFGMPRLVVDYDRVLDDPAIQLERIAKALNLPFDADSTAFQEYKREFLELGLRHNRYSATDLFQSMDIPGGVVELQGLLQGFATDRLSLDNPQIQTIIEHLA